MKAQTAVKKTAEKAVGTSKGGKNTKIHTLVDGLGNPLAFLLSSGNDHDNTVLYPLSAVEIRRESTEPSKSCPYSCRRRE